MVCQLLHSLLAGQLLLSHQTRVTHWLTPCCCRCCRFAFAAAVAFSLCSMMCQARTALCECPLHGLAEIICAVVIQHGSYTKFVQTIDGTETARAASFLQAPGLGRCPVLVSSNFVRSTLHFSVVRRLYSSAFALRLLAVLLKSTSWQLLQFRCRHRVHAHNSPHTASCVKLGVAVQHVHLAVLSCTTAVLAWHVRAVLAAAHVTL